MFLLLCTYEYCLCMCILLYLSYDRKIASNKLTLLDSESDAQKKKLTKHTLCNNLSSHPMTCILSSQLQITNPPSTGAYCYPKLGAPSSSYPIRQASCFKIRGGHVYKPEEVALASFSSGQLPFPTPKPHPPPAATTTTTTLHHPDENTGNPS